jgi:hypothetical protein
MNVTVPGGTSAIATYVVLVAVRRSTLVVAVPFELSIHDATS